MKYQDYSLTLGETNARLCGEKALFLPQSQKLIVADLHFGKAAHFRKNGIAIPGQPDAENLLRLTHLIMRTSASEVIFSGDAFHSEANSSLAMFAEWRHHLPQVRMVLVLGNHDILPVDDYKSLGILILPHRLVTEGLEIVHKSEDASATPGLYALAGHLHPGVLLQGRARQHLQMPCFWQGGNVGVLPAFGSFTGLYMVTPSPGDKIFAFADGQIISLPVPGSAIGATG